LASLWGIIERAFDRAMGVRADGRGRAQPGTLS
jgi:hypothetical protein